MFDFTSSIPDVDTFLQYFINWDLASFWHISVNAVPEIGSVWFCALIGIKFGMSVLRQAFDL